MTREEEIKQNLERACQHVLWLLDHPDELAAITDGATIDLRDQAYYWTEEWQEGERESQAERDAGQTITFKSAAAAIAWLQADD